MNAGFIGARTCGRAILALLTGWLMASCSPTEHTLQVASHVWVGYESLYLAQQQGWLDASKVQLVGTSAATDTLQALRTGAVDAGALTLDEVLSARASGLPLTIVLVFDVSAGADVLLARPGIGSVAELKGRRLGHEHGATGELLLAAALEQAQLRVADVQPVHVTPAEQERAWDAQRLDAVITYEPYASRIRALGAHPVFDSRQVPNTIVDVLAVRTDRLDSVHAAGLRHTAAAHFRALQHLRSNPQDAAYRMAEHLGLDVAEVLPSFRGLLLPTLENNRRLLNDWPIAPLEATAEGVRRLMLQEHLLERAGNNDHLIDVRYLPDWDQGT